MRVQYVKCSEHYKIIIHKDYMSKKFFLHRYSTKYKNPTNNLLHRVDTKPCTPAPTHPENCSPHSPPLQGFSHNQLT